MTHAPDDIQLPPSLKFLKALVILLMCCMIAGVITVSALLVTRLKAPSREIALPSHLELPAGARPDAVTMGRDFIAVVSDKDQIFIFNLDGTLRQEVAVTPARGE